MIYVISLIVIGILLGLLVLFINTLFCFVYLFIDYRLGEINSPTTYPTAAPRSYLRNLLSEFWYILGVYYLYPLKFCSFSANVKPKAGTTHDTAILLIHGYGRNKTDLLGLLRRLRSLACPIFTVNLKPDFASIEQITSNSIVPKVEKILAKTNCKRLILIGHSMGGLVASYYSERLDDAQRVKAVITIGSPLHGTKLALTSSFPNGVEMYPAAKFTAELRNAIAKSKRSYYNIASSFDNIVFPWNSAIIDNLPAERQLVLPFAAHLGMLHSKVVANHIIGWINALLLR